MTADHYRWADLAADSPAPSIVRKYVSGDHVTVARFELAAGGVVPRHSHDNEQVSCVLTGALRFRFGDREMLARAGDVIRIPGGLAHEVEVVEDAVVIDVFSPVRRDWIDKKDDYFRAKR